MSFQGFPPGSVPATFLLETVAAVLPAKLAFLSVLPAKLSNLPAQLASLPSKLVFLPVHPDALPTQPAGPVDLCSQLWVVAESQETFNICRLRIQDPSNLMNSTG